MSDTLPAKVIIPGAAASQATEGTTNSQSTETPSPAPFVELSRRTVEELDNSLPEKFKGKSVYDVVDAYSGLEKEKGRLASEVGQARKEAEEAKARAALAEQKLQEAAALRANQQQSTQPQPQIDPLSDFDKRFAEEPAEAIKAGIKSAHEIARRAEYQTTWQLQQQAAQQRYETLKKDKSDFAELEPEMVQLAQRFGAYLRPEVANRPEVIDLMYDIARGRNVEKFVGRAIEKAKASGELVREEKRNTFSESSNSQGESDTPFEDLSLEEMAKRLGRSKA